MFYEHPTKPRGEIPFLDRRLSGSCRYKRPVPEDLRPALARFWSYSFPKETPVETIRAAAEALAKFHDEVITERRARLKGIQLAGAR